jgi:hypothetical protein
MAAVPGPVEFALIAVPAALAIAALEGRARVDPGRSESTHFIPGPTMTNPRDSAVDSGKMRFLHPKLTPRSSKLYVKSVP